LPAGNWRAADFDDEAWATGNGGFGKSGTPGAKIGTTWNAVGDIYIRRKFNLPANALERGKLMLKVHHDEGCIVYINGALALSLSGYTSNYSFYDMTEAGKAALVLGGENTLAVRCSNTTGGQYIDVGISILEPDAQEAIETVKKNDCRIYPNPVKNVLNIVRQQPNTEIKGIYNTLGSLVKLPDSYDSAVNISDLAGGTYFLLLKTDNRHQALTFIKE
jgi:hypothetical protein